MSWKIAQENVEKELHSFLGLSNEESVIYVNRAANAIHMALHWLHSGSNTARVWIDEPTFHAARRIVERMGLLLANTIHTGDTIIPRALGGESIEPGWFDDSPCVIYDCAQTCYPNMFEDIGFGLNQFAVLSFQKSKPCGTPSGGGALVCNKHYEKAIRRYYVPGNWYYNPRTGQCIGTKCVIKHRDHARIAERQAEKFHSETTRLWNKHKIGIYNWRNGLRSANIFTHVYVRTPEDKKIVHGLLRDGYSFYAENKLMRKALV